MANLPNFADRMENSEIAANKPVTESLFQKIGSNINFLLDFLGVSDGETAPSGVLTDFTQALNLVQSHTISFQAALIPGGGTQLVGTYSPIKFVDRLFWFRGGAPNNSSVSIALMKKIDGGPTYIFNSTRATPANPGGLLSSTPLISGPDGPLGSYQGGGQPPLNPFEPGDVRGGFFDGGLGTTGYTPAMAQFAFGGRIDYHEFDSSLQVFSNAAAGPNEIWMSYSLNFNSSPLYYE